MDDNTHGKDNKEDRQQGRRGDVIRASIGESARGIVVGKNIIQIGMLVIPMWLVAVITTSVVVGAVSTAGVFGGKILRRFQPTPTPGPMSTRAFNVVIADLVIDGASNQEEYATFSQEFADNLLADLQTEFHKHDTELDFDFRRVSLQGVDPADRHNAVAAVASKLRADVVIYGVLEIERNPARFTPEYYIHPSLTGAEESTGPDAFGQPIDVHFRPDDPVNKIEFVANTGPRLNAFNMFMVGLAFFKAQKYDLALQQFSLVYDTSDWANTDRPSILFLWLGTTHQYRALQAGEPVKNFYCLADNQATNDWACTLASYEKAKGEKTKDGKTEKDFPRAYIGLGNYWLDLDSATPNVKDGCIYYPRAIEQYQTALEMATHPTEENRKYIAETYVLLKTYYNMGLTYARALRYQPPCNSITSGETNYHKAVQYLTMVVKAYEVMDISEKKKSIVGDITSRASYQLGLIYHLQGDFPAAIVALTKTIDIAKPENDPGERWQSIRWIAQNQLGKVYLTLAEAGDHAMWKQAITTFDEIIDGVDHRRFGYASDDEAKVVSAVYYGRGKAYNHIAQLKKGVIDTEQTTKAITDLNKSIQIVTDMNPKAARDLEDLPWVSYVELGHAQMALAQTGEATGQLGALAAYQRLIQEFEKPDGDSIEVGLVAEAYYEAGLLHDDQGNSEEALDNLGKALKAAKQADPAIAILAQQRLNMIEQRKGMK